MTLDTSSESFENFKDSFSYGSRTDLNFKFLKSFSGEEAARFFQELLWKLGYGFDDGDIERLIALVYEGQIRAYAGEGHWKYDQGPFSAPVKPLSVSRLALLTSSGHFVEGEDPNPFGVEGMTQAEAAERISEFLQAEPELSLIPTDTPRQKLRVRHGGYDVRGAQADSNVVFPYERLLELEREGVIGELAPTAYSFVGACSQIRPNQQAGPRWVEMLQGQGIDAALLVPV